MLASCLARSNVVQQGPCCRVPTGKALAQVRAHVSILNFKSNKNIHEEDHGSEVQTRSDSSLRSWAYRSEFDTRKRFVDLFEKLKIEKTRKHLGCRTIKNGCLEKNEKYSFLKVLKEFKLGLLKEAFGGRTCGKGRSNTFSWRSSW